jgi:hypothetical protein
MIDLFTVAGLHERDHQLHAFCLRCDRWQQLDLARMVREGYGERRLPICVRCRDCGEQGRVQVRPPAPTRSSSGWIAPPVIPAA